MDKFTLENDKFQPIENIDLLKAGDYLIRNNSDSPEYKWQKNHIMKLQITDKTATNGFWVFLDGHSLKFDFFYKGYEFVGPWKIKESKKNS